MTPGIFIVYLLVTRRFRAAGAAIGTLVGTMAVSAVVAPQATWDFWTHHVFDTNRVGRLENSVNQSLLGSVVRATHSNEPGVLSTVVAVVVVALGMAAATFCYRRLGDAWALPVAAATALLASPISWSHHWVWCVPVIALAFFEARALLLPMLAVFWTFAVWWVPHGNAVELYYTPLQVASAAWYAMAAVAFVGYAVIRARADVGRPVAPMSRTARGLSLQGAG